MRILFAVIFTALLASGQRFQPKVPKTWDTEALADWATPVAGLGVRPGHFSEVEYYDSPVDNLRTYPVYYPGREPEGYWDMLQTIGPQPLIEPERLNSEADWIRAGKRVFEEYDVPSFRNQDPELIAAARNPQTFAKSRVKARPDGTLPDLRWVPTPRGLALGLVNCAGCHIRAMPDNTLLHGAPANEAASPLAGRLARWGVSAVPLTGDSPAMFLWRAFAAPWIKDDTHEALKALPVSEQFQKARAAFAPGLFPRWNGSALYPTKIPDLIGFKDRKYIDHTATHQHRGPGDLMRYAAMVTYSDSSDFGPHRMLTDEQRKIPCHLPDEALYALTLYIYSLQPPPDPHVSDPVASTGRKIFEREGCAGCHTPPLYTSNRVTLALGFQQPREHGEILKVLPVTVGTDPGLALKTRKGTGYYKVPSLRGVWYRGHYLHDGALTSLEEMFDPARLREDYVPGGFKPFGVKSGAVKGHEFGIRLPAEEKNALIAFLKTL